MVETQVEHEYVQTNGVTLHVAQAGPQDGPLVILLHGFPEFWYGWRAQIPALANAGFRVWAPDQRGYNLSDKPSGVSNYDLTNLSGDIIGLMDAAGVERAHVVGHDWGAAVSWHLATRHADRVEKLAIFNVPHPAVFAPFLRSHPTQLLKSWYMLFFQMPYLPELFVRKAGRFIMSEGGRSKTFSESELDRYEEVWNQPGMMTAAINWYRAEGRRAARRLTAGRRGGSRIAADPTVRVPTLVVWGEDDPVLDHRMADRSVELCEEGRLVKLPGVTHWVQHEAADRVNQLLIGHLQNTEAGANSLSGSGMEREDA